MKVFIRHSDKEHSNLYEEQFGLDSPLSEDGKIKVYDSVHQGKLKIRRKFTRVIVSPYLRTRQTAESLKASLSSIGLETGEIEIETLLGEKFGKSRDIKTTCFRPETLCHDPIVNFESPDVFKKRIDDFIAKYQKDLESNEDVLFVAHGFTIQSIGNQLGYNVEYPNTLDGFALKGSILKQGLYDSKSFQHYSKPESE